MLDLFRELKKVNPYATCNTTSGSEVSTWIDTGVYALNALISGSIYKGFPGNKVVVFAGEPSCGKTFMALSILKNFLDMNPTGQVVIFDSEGDIRKEEMQKRGLDTTRVIQLPVDTVYEFGNQIAKTIDLYEKAEKPYPLFIALDSLGQLASDKESEDLLEGKQVSDMSRARTIKSVFRTITNKLNRAGVPLLVTNHVYASMSAYSGKVQAGGSGAIYASSQIISLSKSKEVDGDKNTIGGIITAKTDKSRFTREGQKISMLLYHASGLDRYFGLHHIALAGKIFEKDSTKIKLPSGESIFGKELTRNPEKYYTKEILDAIDVASQKIFMYGADVGADAIEGEEQEEELLNEIVEETKETKKKKAK